MAINDQYNHFRKETTTLEKLLVLEKPFYFLVVLSSPILFNSLCDDKDILFIYDFTFISHFVFLCSC